MKDLLKMDRGHIYRERLTRDTKELISLLDINNTYCIKIIKILSKKCPNWMGDNRTIIDAIVLNLND